MKSVETLLEKRRQILHQMDVHQLALKFIDLDLARHVPELELACGGNEATPWVKTFWAEFQRRHSVAQMADLLNELVWRRLTLTDLLVALLRSSTSDYREALAILNVASSKPAFGTPSKERLN